jgi:hypothetical protein
MWCFPVETVQKFVIIVLVFLFQLIIISFAVINTEIYHSILINANAKREKRAWARIPH